MRYVSSLALVGVMSVPFALFAQQPANPVSSSLRDNAERYGRNLVAAAEEMPAEKYGFKPTDPQMSFADVVLHLANGNEFMCSGISGGKAPTEPELKTADGKDKLVARLKRSFEYCQSSVAKLDDSKLGENVPFFGGRQVSRARLIMAAGEDWADHYSQLAIYLRLNGLLPPTAKPKK